MYTAYYAECSDLSSELSRNNEWSALDNVISGLKMAKEEGYTTTQARQALHNTLMVWSFLLEDLSDNDNDFPEQLRADLISIGIFIIKQIGRIFQAQSEDIESDVAGLIDINTAIRDGLVQ
ncbi:flagellar protein FlaF [Cohaesibacter sp. ES.047]|nr:flagellar protein FlaF [Cohaesibacter sp. ES.047]